MLIKYKQKIGWDNCVVALDLYGGTMQYFRKVAPNQGITYTMVDITDIDGICNAIAENTKLVYFEPMSNPTLIVADVGKIATRVHAVNPDIVVAVDNTFFSPYNFRPLDVGVDISINSATKYINGHCDVTMGLVACNSDILKTQMHRFGQWTIGAVPSPFDCLGTSQFGPKRSFSRV